VSWNALTSEFVLRIETSEFLERFRADVPTISISAFFAFLVFLAGDCNAMGFGTRFGDGSIFVGVGFTCEFGVRRMGDFGNDDFCGVIEASLESFIEACDKGDCPRFSLME
jgi:hypothetical protein